MHKRAARQDGRAARFLEVRLRIREKSREEDHAGLLDGDLLADDIEAQGWLAVIGRGLELDGATPGRVNREAPAQGAADEEVVGAGGRVLELHFEAAAAVGALAEPGARGGAGQRSGADQGDLFLKGR